MMKTFLLILIIIIFTASIILIGVGCKKIDESSTDKAAVQETTTDNTTEVETIAKDKIAFASYRDGNYDIYNECRRLESDKTHK